MKASYLPKGHFGASPLFLSSIAPPLPVSFSSRWFPVCSSVQLWYVNIYRMTVKNRQGTPHSSSDHTSVPLANVPDTLLSLETMRKHYSASPHTSVLTSSLFSIKASFQFLPFYKHHWATLQILPVSVLSRKSFRVLDGELIQSCLPRPLPP